MEQSSAKKKRLPYHKPRVEEVRLKAEEVVLQGCKAQPCDVASNQPQHKCSAIGS